MIGGTRLEDDRYNRDGVIYCIENFLENIICVFEI